MKEEIGKTLISVEGWRLVTCKSSGCAHLYHNKCTEMVAYAEGTVCPACHAEAPEGMQAMFRMYNMNPKEERN